MHHLINVTITFDRPYPAGCFIEDDDLMIPVCCLSCNVCICTSSQLMKCERMLYLVKISIRDKEKLIGLSRLCCCLVIY